METAGQIGMIDDFYIKPLLGIIKYNYETADSD